MLSSNVLKAIQLASLGAGCATAASASASAEPPARAPLTTQAREPAMDMSARVREKIAVIAGRNIGHEEKPSVRIEAIRALAEMMDETAVGPLAVLLENSASDAIRAEIASALKKLNAGNVLAKAASDPRPEVRTQALRLLRVVCDRASEGSAKAMRAGLDDPDPTVRTTAATALGRCGGPVDVPALAGRLTDENDEVRSAVAQALGNFQDARAQAALEKALENEADPFVQVFIRGSLKRLKAKSTTPR